MRNIISKMVKGLNLDECATLEMELNAREYGKLSEFEEELMGEARRATKSAYQVVLVLGHCGANPNHYPIFNGAKDECEAWLDELPETLDDKICPRCGGYTGTNPVQEECYIEEVEAVEA